MRHTHYAQPRNTAIIQKINVTLTLSRVESALYREDVTAVVGFQANKKEKVRRQYEISVATTTGQLLSSQQLDTAAAVATATPISQMKRSRHDW